MAFKVNYGPTGTTLVQVGDQFYLTYEVKGKKLYWSVSKSQLNSITDAGKLTFNEDGTLATSIEGFKTVNPGTWNALQENGTLWNAGTLLGFPMCQNWRSGPSVVALFQIPLGPSQAA